MRKTAVSILIIISILIASMPYSSAEGRYTGEEIKANPEQMSREHSDYAINITKAIAKFAADAVPAAAAAKFMVKGSEAFAAINDFDGGWFPSCQKIGFSNERAENFTGYNINSFDCDVFMDCIVKFDAKKIKIYDIAYHLKFVCEDNTRTDEKRWKVSSFTNIDVGADAIDTLKYSSMDDGLELRSVTGQHCKGFMLLVSDPSRIIVGTCKLPFDEKKAGWQLDTFSDKYNAAAVINGGGFADPNGMGKGGQANGIVVSQGHLIQKHIGGKPFGTIIGFDTNDKLIVRDDIARGDSDSLHLRDAVAFNPALIQDGKRTKTSYEYKYLSCRTAIGQRADGTVLMLVLDGRQPDSLGANFNDLCEIMLEFGAVTAANLDGGTSTALVMFGDKINDGTSPDYVSRYMPTAFIVKK